jgi:hypothetical protein
MRRARAILFALALLPVFAAPAAAGGKPDRFLDPAPSFVIPAGDYCAFDVRLENVVDHLATTIYPPTADGSQRIMINGHVVVRVTNLASGAWFEVGNSAMITIWFFGDGSVKVAFGGPLFAFYTAAEAPVSTLPQGLWYVRGHGSEEYGADGSLISATAVGAVTDVCALLAPNG